MERGASSSLSSRLPLLLLAACLVLLPATTTHAVPINYCDKKNDYAVKVKGVEMHPNPIVSGKPAKFTISATTGDAITGGKLVIDVSYFGLPIHEETHNLCSETSCPVSTGDFELSHQQSLPPFTPPGKYTLKMKMLGESGNELTCISFQFKIKLRSPVDDS